MANVKLKLGDIIQISSPTDTDLDGHVFLHKVFQQAGSRASVYSQKISDSLGKCFQVGRCGFVLVVGVGLGESFKGYFIADLHLDGHEVFDGDVVMFIHAYFIL
jgi:hypothetical protein